MKKILTIVVPSYNTQKYIDEVLPSFVNENSDERLEVLLVNDGSIDNTLELLKQYELKFGNIVRVIDKENGGHGSTINRGISEAKGKYFKVIDGDDWVELNSINALINSLEGKEVDLVINPYYTFDEKKRSKKLHNFKIEQNAGTLLLEDCILNAGRLMTLHAITYRTELLKSNNLSFRENCYYEDAEYIMYPLLYTKTVCFLDFPVYVYRVGSPTQSISIEKAFKNKTMVHLIAKDCVDFYTFHNNEFSKNINQYILNFVASRVISGYNVFFKTKMTKEIKNELCLWDENVKKTMPLFYKYSSVFPINLLRLNFTIWIYPICFMYKLYFKVRSI